MAQDVSPHNWSDNLFIFILWLSIEDIISRWLGGKSKGTKSIHNQINPKHLNGIKWRISHNNWSEENDEHSTNVNSKLELQEFSNIIKYTSSVFKSNDNRGEVII